MRINPSILYTTDPLDRAGLRRRDPDWLKLRHAGTDTRYVPIWRGRNLVRETAAGLEALTLGRDRLDDAAEATLLGLDGETAYFLVELTDEDPLARLGLDPGAGFHDLRTVAGRLTPREAAILAHAKGMLYWHSRHRFCGICGSATVSEDAGHVRRCTNPACATAHFPRTDPAVIMLVSDGDRVLLGRQKSWGPGLYSVLAGFVEPGETLEAAVAREVFEETGIAIGEIRYRGSQPWPFPGSIMLGFRAVARSTEIRIDPNELEEARWVPRRHLIDHPDDPALRVPPGGSISRRLIEDWLAESD